ncbi:hypothetical protein [Adhaeretor mobilis]|uniref:DUF2292 domain-containing protein n=1 Tax=Adhaeretor mobilis TaxID=1930276 RepID=A0A517N2B8_9BACT|nr:hypothetical protein [Adhaeretor mobilis]QDT01272.1 hypothetical protein HG15A2_46140 [Adhaeretor mobilis]
MNDTRSTRTGGSKQQLPVRELQRLLLSVSQRGFHGTATLTVSLQDGHVQHVRVASEQMVRG